MNGHLYNLVGESPAWTRSPTRHPDTVAFRSSDPSAVHTTDFIYEWNRPGIYLPSISAVYSRSTALSNLVCVSPTHAMMSCRDGRLAAIDHRYRRRIDVRPSPSMSATGGMHRWWIQACMGEKRFDLKFELFFCITPTALYGVARGAAVCGGWPTRVVGRVVK